MTNYIQLAKSKGAEFFERFEERVAIMEYDSLYSRREAERLAYYDLIGA